MCTGYTAEGRALVQRGHELSDEDLRMCYQQYHEAVIAVLKCAEQKWLNLFERAGGKQKELLNMEHAIGDNIHQLGYIPEKLADRLIALGYISAEIICDPLAAFIAICERLRAEHNLPSREQVAA